MRSRYSMRMVLVAVFLLGLCLMVPLGRFCVSVFRVANKISREIEEIIYLDFCQCRLVTVGEEINAYRKSKGGPAETTLEQIVPGELLYCPKGRNTGGRVPYVFRGDDVPEECDKDVILVYERDGDHASRELRNVLFNKGTLTFYVDDSKRVSEQEYRERCLEILEERDPGLVIQVRKGEKVEGAGVVRINDVLSEIDLSFSGAEHRERMCEEIREDYETGKLATADLAFKVVTTEGWERIAWSSYVRVRSLAEDDFREAIALDNALRKEAGLPEKPVALVED